MLEDLYDLKQPDDASASTYGRTSLSMSSLSAQLYTELGTAVAYEAALWG